MKAMLLALACAASMWAGDLSAYKTVYLLPMSGGLDQFLAVKLAGSGVLQVVTDPEKAELVFSDRIGAGFEEQLEDLDKQKSKNDSTDVWSSGRPASSTGIRNRGTLFLVDRKTHDVVWTVYIKPNGSSTDDLNHRATEIANKLAKDRKGAAK